MLMRELIIFCVLSLLSACGHLGSPGHIQSRSMTAADYLNLAAQANPHEKQIYLLNAAQQYLQTNQAEAAQRILSTVKSSYLDNAHSLQLSLLLIYVRAEIAQTALAIEQLAPFINNPNLSTENQILLHRILAKAYQNQGNLAATLDQMNQVQNLLSNSAERQKNLMATWNMVDNLNVATLQEWLNKTDSTGARGWLDLAIIDNSYYSPNEFLSAIKNWESEYFNHPARKLISSHNLIIHSSPKHVALLLPLSGPYASSSEAIRNGFFAAYYYGKQHQENAPSITVYDTQHNVAAVYQKAVQEGADLVVGPLTKEEVAAVAQYSLTVPTLALNSSQEFGEQRVSNLYQFDLSPVTEARDVALEARGHNLSKAIVFALPADWSQNIAKSFQQQWKSAGGRIVKVITVQNSEQLDDSIRHVLHTQAASNPTPEQAHSRSAQKRDFDLVFLATSAAQARQIVPLLRFYANDNLPVFATSLIYDGSASSLTNSDLNGVSFCSMPWLVQPSANLSPSLMTIRNNTQSLWAGSFNHYPKLYAVGVDAYNLIANLNKLVIMPELGANGATGRLYLNNNHSIDRKVLWATMHNGSPQTDP